MYIIYYSVLEDLPKKLLTVVIIPTYHGNSKKIFYLKYHKKFY